MKFTLVSTKITLVTSLEIEENEINITDNTTIHPFNLQSEVNRMNDAYTNNLTFQMIHYIKYQRPRITEDPPNGKLFNSSGLMNSHRFFKNLHKRKRWNRKKTTRIKLLSNHLPHMYNCVSYNS